MQIDEYYCHEDDDNQVDTGLAEFELFVLGQRYKARALRARPGALVLARDIAMRLASIVKKCDKKSLHSFVERYKSEIDFGDAESKKVVLRALVASAVLDNDDLRLVPNYPALTGVKMASPGGFEPPYSP